MDQKLITVGRIVLYTPHNQTPEPTALPLPQAAIVVSVWHAALDDGDNSAGMSNLFVFPDGSNSGAPTLNSGGQSYVAGHWATSICYSEDRVPGTWSFPPRV